MDDHFDVFISHASEDKADFVIPLVGALKDRGLTVWFDAEQILLGDDFREKMDEGLALARFGVVVLSPSFSKYWPEAELSALFNQERVFGELKILPVLHLITHADVTRQWPLAAGKASASSADGVDRVADLIFQSIKARTAPTAGSPTATAGASGHSRLVGVPALPSTNFVGRTEELAALEKLLGPSSVALAASVEGLAGVGKTELALQLVHQLAKTSAYPGGIYWLSAEDPDLTAVWGGPLADQLGEADAPIAARAWSIVRRLSRQSRPLLVVLDNVESWTQNSYPRPLPEGHHVRRLITTRQHRLAGAQFQHVELGFLDEESSERLLQSLAGEALAEMSGWQKLLQYLGGHALAIELAGAYLAETPGASPSGYLANLGGDEKSQQSVADLVRYGRTVSQALELTWQGLTPEHRDAWCLAACFAPEVVLPPISAAVGLTPEKLRPLRRYHLIETAPSGAWRMHRLVQDFGRSRDALIVERASKTFLEGCKDLTSSYQWGDDPRWLIQHLSHLERSCENPDLAAYPPELLRKLGLLRRSVGDYVGAQERFEQAIHLARDNSGGKRFKVDLALVLKDQGDLPGARTLLEQALAVDLEVHGENHPTVARTRSNLAIVLKAQGDLPGARTLLEQALAVDLEAHGENHPTVARIRSNLALVLKDQGDLPGARTLLEQALAVDLEVHGESHPTVATRRSNLALVLKAQGDLPGARTLLEQALAVDLEVHGENHPTVATSRSNLALVLKDQGDLPGARALLEQALAVDLEVHGESHPTVATRRSNLATVLVAQGGDLPGARTLLEQALQTFSQMLGDEHPNTNIVRGNLDFVLNEMSG